MFESDDFDQVLSQFDFPDEPSNKQLNKEITNETITSTKKPSIINNETLTPTELPINSSENKCNNGLLGTKTTNFSTELKADCSVSPKHTKRKIINSLFDHKSKRKFPGPAGLLSGTLEETTDENICHIELLSQDIDFSQNHLQRHIFESPLWSRLSEDIKNWNVGNIDTIKTIKQQTLAKNLRQRKARTVTAFVETVDRTVTDPLIILRDPTGSIKCTLHRDAWSTFSSYILSKYCAFVLCKPTILTTGSAYKKHYLNITLSNILAIYSSTVLKDNIENKSMPDGYVLISDEEFTIIKKEDSTKDLDTNIFTGLSNETNDLMDGLDSIFSDEIF